MSATITSPAVATPQRHGPSLSWRLETPKETANKKVVLGLYGALNSGNLSVVNQAMRPDLIQHYPEIAGGSAAFRKYQADLRKKFPQLRIDVKRVIVEGDIVMVHSHFIAQPGDLGFAKVGLFRLQCGKIAEYWEVNEKVPPPANVGNDMFSTLSSPQVTFPTRLSKDASSERAGRGVFADVINQPDETLRVAAIEHYIGDNTYFQHFPGIPNGAAGVRQFTHDLWAAHADYRANVKVVIAQGDMVFLLIHLENFFDVPQAVSGDIFRVRDGKLLEHWGVFQAVPPTSANGNTMY